jgi:hypothetical protein
MYAGWDDANDVARGRRLMPLVEEGFAASLTEAATRFALHQGRSVCATTASNEGRG